MAGRLSYGGVLAWRVLRIFAIFAVGYETQPTFVIRLCFSFQSPQPASLSGLSARSASSGRVILLVFFAGRVRVVLVLLLTV